jgi:uncharacterized protein YdiU (UPF0061 family)
MPVETSLSGGLEQLAFDNSFTRDLPGDPETANRRRQVPRACFSRVLPTPVSNPSLIGWSPEVATLLGLDPLPQDPELMARVFSGNLVLPGMDPFAMCYGGHQFGSWAGQLGDGRAINLGEVVNHSGQRHVLQLKGAGPTPYSRTADGLAVLRSSIREFLCSEAMHHLGVPTTRALSLVLTGEQVVRDMFYDGNPAREPGAVVCRVAPSFTRFGNFQILSARGETDILRRLVDHTIRHDFPHLGEPGPDTDVRWFHEVCRATADMVVHWMRVGFVHGVMNTDNMSILGQTIDYGPYGWLENYDPDWTPNTTDASGRRYRFGNQPQVAMWNLLQLGNALVPLFNETEPLQAGIDHYADSFQQGWRKTLGLKLGIADATAGDKPVFDELLAILAAVETDMTIFFRNLAHVDPETIGTAPPEALTEAYYRPEQVTTEHRERTLAWLRQWGARLRAGGTGWRERARLMNTANPKYVLRNYLAQQAIDKATAGDPSMIAELLDLLRHPYDEQSHREPYAARRPDWARHKPGCSMLSCSS